MSNPWNPDWLAPSCPLGGLVVWPLAVARCLHLKSFVDANLFAFGFQSSSRRKEKAKQLRPATCQLLPGAAAGKPTAASPSPPRRLCALDAVQGTGSPESTARPALPSAVGSPPRRHAPQRAPTGPAPPTNRLPPPPQLLAFASNPVQPIRFSVCDASPLLSPAG